MSLTEIVIENIKKYRKLKGLSQEQLAEKCNTATSYIGLLETHKKSPRLDTIERIANALEIDSILLFQASSEKNMTIDPELNDKIVGAIKKTLDELK